jgi:hypothetical protein
VVSVGTKPPLVHVVEALTKSIIFRSPSLFRNSSWLATKARPLSLTPSPQSPWCRFHYGASHEGGVSSSPAQSCRRHSTRNRRVEDLPTSYKDSKEPAHRDTSLRFTQEPTQDHNTLLSYSLSRASLALHLTKLVINLRIWSMSSLIGLENFSRVSITSRELQQPQMIWIEALYRIDIHS